MNWMQGMQVWMCGSWKHKASGPPPRPAKNLINYAGRPHLRAMCRVDQKTPRNCQEVHVPSRDTKRPAAESRHEGDKEESLLALSG